LWLFFISTCFTGSSVLERTQPSALSQCPLANRSLNHRFHLAEETMNLSKIVCGLTQFDDRHDLGKSFARSHVAARSNDARCGRARPGAGVIG
jgi:hypothetical protein